MEQYMAFTRGNNGPSIVKRKNRNNVDFEIKSHLMKELIFNLFASTQDEDAHIHVQKLKPLNQYKTWKTIYRIGMMEQPLGCEIYEWMHLTKECPLQEYGKAVKKVKYEGFRSPFSENGGREATWIMRLTKSKKKIEEVKEVNKESVPHDLPMVNMYVEPYVPPIPFQERLKKHMDEPQAFRILKSLKEVKINRLLIYAVKRMSKYLKYVKDMSSSKKSIKEDDA
nr:reverse transcriptase [Tanacetum cinerariifolium]